MTEPDKKRAHETLTRQFNEAARKKSEQKKQAASVQKIRDLKKMLSRPSFVNDPPTLGSVNKGIDLERDRRLMHAIKAMEKILAEKKDKARQQFKQAVKDNSVKRTFNRASGANRMGTSF